MLMLKPKHAFSRFPEFEGDTPFEKEVNRRQAQYFEITGVALGMEMACFDVLADMYNKLDFMINAAAADAEEKKSAKKTGKKDG